MIEDNGIGFNDANLASFCEAYTDRKQAQGGKGIGRISWLKAFSKAEIDSVYNDDTKRKRRTFTFSVGDESEPVWADAVGERKTIVRLVDYLPDYRAKCPTGRLTIARRIIAHFLESFILTTCPNIFLHDEYEGPTINLNQFFNRKLKLGSTTNKFSIDGHKFKIEHLCLAALKDTQHEVHYCAARRSVITHDLREMIPSIRGNLVHTSNKQFVYAAYISGDTLEGTVDELRGRFDIPDENSMFDSDGELTCQALTRKIAEKANEYLANYLKPIRERNNERIRRHVQTKEPKYQGNRILTCVLDKG